MLAAIVEFIGAQGNNFYYVLFGAILLGSASGGLGCFAFLRKKALLGDALTHCSLPGICLGFLVTGSKHPFVLLVGAFCTAMMGALFIQALTDRTVLKEDTAIAAILSTFFGVGVVLLTSIQRSKIGNQAGLDKFLFGQAAGLLPHDVAVLAAMALVLGAILVATFKELKIMTFNPEFAHAMGIPVQLFDILLAALVVVTVVIGLQLVGIVLMAAMLITPAASARQWADRLAPMVILGAIFGAIGSALGVIASAMAPRMPTGPWIVVMVTAIFAISLLISPKRGVFWRAYRLFRVRRHTADENVLRSHYKICEEWQNFEAWITLADILARRAMPLALGKRVIRRLERKGYVRRNREQRFQFTQEGRLRAQRIVRLHRLWELYLTEKIRLPADHVHRDAEEIEHIITPELERELDRALAQPARDPHGKPIPREDHFQPQPARRRGETAT